MDGGLEGGSSNEKNSVADEHEDKGKLLGSGNVEDNSATVGALGEELEDCRTSTVEQQNQVVVADEQEEQRIESDIQLDGAKGDEEEAAGRKERSKREEKK